MLKASQLSVHVIILNLHVMWLNIMKSTDTWGVHIGFKTGLNKETFMAIAEQTVWVCGVTMIYSAEGSFRMKQIIVDALLIFIFVIFNLPVFFAFFSVIFN